jgi:hypothetical protein
MKKILHYFLSALFICLVFYKCKPKQGFGGEKSLYGTVYIQDSLSGNNIPIEGSIIYIGFGYTPNASNYSFKIASDKLGKFNLSNVFDKNGSTSYTYYAHAVYEKTNGSTKTTYTVDQSLSMDSENTLILNTNSTIQNITGKVFMKDSVSSGVIPVTGAEVFLGYNFTPSPSNFTYSVSTDANGFFKTNKIDMSSGSNYQFYVRKIIPFHGNNLSFSANLSYTTFSLQAFTIQLQPNDGIGYMTIKSYDNNNTGQPGFTTCLFSNRTIFMNSVLANGSFYSTTTNQKGFAYVSGLGVGSKYYVKSFKVLGSDTIIGKDSIIYSGTLFPKDSVLTN